MCGPVRKNQKAEWKQRKGKKMSVLFSVEECFREIQNVQVMIQLYKVVAMAKKIQTRCCGQESFWKINTSDDKETEIINQKVLEQRPNNISKGEFGWAFEKGT